MAAAQIHQDPNNPVAEFGLSTKDTASSSSDTDNTKAANKPPHVALDLEEVGETKKSVRVKVLGESIVNVAEAPIGAMKLAGPTNHPPPVAETETVSGPRMQFSIWRRLQIRNFHFLGGGGDPANPGEQNRGVSTKNSVKKVTTGDVGGSTSTTACTTTDEGNGSRSASGSIRETVLGNRSNPRAGRTNINTTPRTPTETWRRNNDCCSFSRADWQAGIRRFAVGIICLVIFYRFIFLPIFNLIECGAYWSCRNQRL